MTGYSEFRQRLYRPRVPLLWWLRRRSYLVFVVRELTSVFIGLYSAWLVVGLVRLAQGRMAWESFLARSSRPAARRQRKGG